MLRQVGAQLAQRRQVIIPFPAQLGAYRGLSRQHAVQHRSQRVDIGPFSLPQCLGILLRGAVPGVKLGVQAVAHGAQLRQGKAIQDDPLAAVHIDVLRGDATVSQAHIVQLAKQRDKRADELPGIGQAHLSLLAGKILLQRLHAQIFGHPVQGVIFGKKHQCFQHRLVVHFHQALPAVVQVAGHGTEQCLALGGDEQDALMVLCPLQDAGEEFLHPHLAVLFGIPGQIGGQQVIVVQHHPHAVLPGEHRSQRQGDIGVGGLRLLPAGGTDRLPLLQYGKTVAAQVRLRHGRSSFRIVASHGLVSSAGSSSRAGWVNR